MNQKEILNKIKASVFNLLKNEGTGHDYFHIERVVNNTKKIISHESCDHFHAILLAYLHDVGDYKLHNGVDKTAEIVDQILSPIIQDKEYIKKVIDDIQLIGFKGGLNQKPKKIEIQIVQDADRLDAIGAIGIARTFAYGGRKERLLYDPNFKPENFKSVEDYKNSKAPTIQHFYDKLLKLKDLMNTKTGKEMADERHRFMEVYLEQFYNEWNA
ncbi:HD domain-containing protein [Weeksellaceae bacterium KMM 9724]|uniref:HD domain-containing protein n=1 Tax=Profundicola chukchiensis TaxID=2961959 RepID=UPI00243A1175|nr:HD domain-containing protein [Profundicola chukchiensis]MDG4950073.1 HD domain-containing protein [Profundicola chukchiensis]